MKVKNKHGTLYMTRKEAFSQWKQIIEENVQ